MNATRLSYATLLATSMLMLSACESADTTGGSPNTKASDAADAVLLSALPALPWTPLAEDANHTPWTAQAAPRSSNAAVQAYADKIEAAAKSGQAVSLPTLRIDTFLGFDDFGNGEDLSLELSRSSLLSADAFFEINGLPYQGPFMRVYEGNLAGQPDNIAHVLVTSDFIRGAVRVGDQVNVIRIAMTGNLPDKLAAASAPNKPVSQPHSAPPSNCPADYIPANDIIRTVPPYLSPINGLGLLGAAELNGRVIVDADRRAYERWGEHLPAMLVGMVIEADLAYRYEVGIRHSIVGIHLNLIGGYYPDPEATDPFGEIAAWWDGHHAGERDIVHFFTGYDSSYAMANCIGSVGTAAGYSFSSIFWEEEYARFHENALAHEFGHLYSAHHHYGNHAESELATIMIQGYTPGAQPQFSSLSRTAIRGWAEEYLDPAD